MSPRPADPGLQAERTLLAWRRTCLTLAVGYLLWIRFLSEELGFVAVLTGVLGLIAVAVCWSLPTIRYRRWHGHLRDDPEGFRVGGHPMLVLATTAVAAGVLGLVAASVL